MQENSEALVALIGVVLGAAVLLALFLEGLLALSGLVFGAAVLLAMYFHPTIIALKHNHLNAGAIVALNLFLGWTGLGWIGALIWASMNTAKPVAAGLAASR